MDDSYFTDEVILMEVDEFSKDCHNNWEAVKGGVFEICDRALFCQQESIVVRYDFTLVHARLPLI